MGLSTPHLDSHHGKRSGTGVCTATLVPHAVTAICTDHRNVVFSLWLRNETFMIQIIT